MYGVVWRMAPTVLCRLLSLLQRRVKSVPEIYRCGREHDVEYARASESSMSLREVRQGVTTREIHHRANIICPA
jgi:hypothetical protein